MFAPAPVHDAAHGCVSGRFAELAAALVTEVAAEGVRVNPAESRVIGAGSRQRGLGAVVN
ncbi:hypothetical protein [Geodermatophilus sp. URMC 65]